MGSAHKERRQTKVIRRASAKRHKKQHMAGAPLRGRGSVLRFLIKSQKAQVGGFLRIQQRRSRVNGMSGLVAQ